MVRARGGRDGQLGERPARGPGGRLEPAPGDDQPSLEGVVGDGSRVVGGAGRPADDRLRRTTGARRPLRRPSAVASNGHGPPARRSRSPASAKIVSTSAPAAALGEPTARQEQLRRRRAARSRGRRPGARAATGPAATRPRRRRSTRRPRRTRRDGRAPPARRGPAAGPGRATVRRRPRRTRRRTRRARTARRTAGSGCAAVGTGMAGSWLCSGEGTSRPPSIGVDGRPAEAFVTWVATRRPGRHTW